MKASRICAWALMASLLPLLPSLWGCHARAVETKGGGQAAAAVEPAEAVKGSDPRSAFESSGMLGGLSARLDSSLRFDVAAGTTRRSPEAGVVLALGGPLSNAAVARRLEPSIGAKGFGHELALASGAKTALPGPTLALAATGDRIVVACVDPDSPSGGALLGFRAEGEGEKLVLLWRIEGRPARLFLSVPSGRIAVADDSGGEGGAPRVYLIDSANGAELWSASLLARASDIAYAPGLVLAASGSKLEAFDESTGGSAWIASLTAEAGSLAAGNGVALVLADTGSLSAFSLTDGKGIGAAPGPFDPSVRPIADGDRAIAAMTGGGAQEIEIKTGSVRKTWLWAGPSSFIAADRERIYAGIDGRDGRGLRIEERAGDAKGRLISLEAGAFDAPVAVSGARGGLLLLLLDGSLVLVGKDREPDAAPSALDAAIAPPAATAQAIGTALGRFKPAEGADAKPYLSFDLFAQGMPVETGSSFTAFRYEPSTSAKRAFYADPASSGAIVAIYDQDGLELAASIDELGSVSSAGAYLEKGRSYWIVAGWTYQAEPLRFRVFTKP